MTMRNSFVLIFLAVLCKSAISQIESKNADPALIFYKIQAGDTLIKLSKKYLIQPANLEAIQRLNKLKSIDLLPTGKLLKIPREAVNQSPSQAIIIALSCSRPIRAGLPLKRISIGSTLNEGTVIDIPSECHASILLEDGSIIRLPSSSAIKLSTLRKNPLETTPEVRLDLVRGKIELEVDKSRTQTTPFEVRTPLSMTGVRGTEFRVGYSSTEQAGQVEVLGGSVGAMGVNDTEFKTVEKGQGMPLDDSGKSLPVEKLLNPPVFERAQLAEPNSTSFNIKLSTRSHTQAKHYITVAGKSTNLLDNRTVSTLLEPEITTPDLTLNAHFYQFSTVSKSGLMGPYRQYGFCIVPNDVKQGRCKATFDAPMTENVMIEFSLIRKTPTSTQEFVSTQKLQSRNGQFTIEGLPSGHYNWSMSYKANDIESTPTTINQSGSFDLITLTPP